MKEECLSKQETSGQHAYPVTLIEFLCVNWHTLNNLSILMGLTFRPLHCSYGFLFLYFPSKKWISTSAPVMGGYWSLHFQIMEFASSCFRVPKLFRSLAFPCLENQVILICLQIHAMGSTSQATTPLVSMQQPMSKNVRIIKSQTSPQETRTIQSIYLLLTNNPQLSGEPHWRYKWPSEQDGFIVFTFISKSDKGIDESILFLVL